MGYLARSTSRGFAHIRLWVLRAFSENFADMTYRDMKFFKKGFESSFHLLSQYIREGVDLDTGIGFGGSTADEEQPERRDYSAFFGELHTLARVEDEVRDSLDLFFLHRNNVTMVVGWHGTPLM